MKTKFFMVLIALAMVFSFSYGLQAQTLTSDIVFLKVGYVPISTTSFDEVLVDKNEANGFAIQGEYNLNFNNFWIGFGLEYQRLSSELKTPASTSDKYINQFIQPMISAKFAAVGGLYVGASLSGKYLIATEKKNGFEWDKKFDVWANGIIGYYMPIAEAVFLDLEGKFGYNLTNQQFADDTDVKSNYDIAVYVGIGYRAAGSDY